MSGTFSGGCYAPGEILHTAVFKGEVSGTGLVGKIVEHPVVIDYIKETHHVDDKGVPIALLLDTDWWDAGDKSHYFDFLVKHHPRLSRRKLDRLKPEPVRPDILTLNGPVYSPGGVFLSRKRHEYYEIKPDSPSGLKAGKDKLPELEKFYHDFRLPYKPGTTYPANPGKIKEIPLPLNRLFVYLAKIFLRRHGIKGLRIYMSVRRYEDKEVRGGLLLYKICAEIETDDKRKQKTLAKAAAKHLYAAYVVCHFPEKFAGIKAELGDYSFEGDKLPRIRCRFDVIDDLKPLLKTIEEQLYMRGIALPGEEYLLCCDEAYYWELLAGRPYGTSYLWQKALAAAKTWVNYAAGSVGWAKIQTWVEKGENIGARLKERFPYHVAFADAVIEYARKNPLEFILIISLPVMITAGAAILFEAGLLAGVIAAEGSVAGSSGAVASGLGRVAMSEAVAAEILGPQVAAGAASRGLMTVQQVAAQIGGAGAAANDIAAISGALSQSALPGAIKTVSGMGIAAAFLLGVNTRTAYAQTAGPASGQGQPQLRPDAKPIAQAVSRLLAVRPLAVPRNTIRPAIKGELINLFNYAPVAAPFRHGEPPVLPMYYLGRVTIS